MEEKEKIVFDVRFFFLLFFPLSAIPEKKIREDKPGKRKKKKGGGEGEKKRLLWVSERGLIVKVISPQMIDVRLGFSVSLSQSRNV